MHYEDCVPELQALLHPSQTFAKPADVLRAGHLSRDEKRAILAAWASDACAVEAAPGWRRAPGGLPVAWDDIMDALQTLDLMAGSKRGHTGKRQAPSSINGPVAAY